MPGVPPGIPRQDPDRTIRVYDGRPVTCLLCWEMRSKCRALYVRTYRDSRQTGRRDWVRIGWICPSCVAKCLDHMEAERQVLEDVLEAP